MIVFKTQEGVTLIETMLVFAIVSSILVLGLRMYKQAQNRTTLSQLQADVDQVFEAASLYYKANCYGSYSNAGVFIPGDLNPVSAPRPAPATAAAPSTTTPTVVDINAQLITPGYLTNFNINPVSGLISPPTTGAFVVQFNPILSTANGTNASVNLPSQSAGITSVYCNGNACPANTFLPNPLPPAGTNFAGSNQSIVLTWRIQIAVQVANAAMAEAYQAILGADCVSGPGASGEIIPCEEVPAAGGYLVWERLPSFASPNTTSSLSQSMPLLKQFNLQYTHDQMYELGNEFPTPPPQYYLCGS